MLKLSEGQKPNSKDIRNSKIVSVVGDSHINDEVDGDHSDAIMKIHRELPI